MIYRVYALTRISESWSEEVDDFSLLAHCEVEEIGKPGGEAFVVNIASPKRIERWLADGHEKVILGRGYLFMSGYDESAVLALLQGIIDRSNAATWEQLRGYVERFFDWLD